MHKQCKTRVTIVLQNRIICQLQVMTPLTRMLPFVILRVSRIAISSKEEPPSHYPISQQANCRMTSRRVGTSHTVIIRMWSPMEIIRISQCRQEQYVNARLEIIRVMRMNSLLNSPQAIRIPTDPKNISIAKTLRLELNLIKKLQTDKISMNSRCKSIKKLSWTKYESKE